MHLIFKNSCAILFGLLCEKYHFYVINIFIPAIIGGGRLLKMGVLETILIILEAICSIALIAVVLMQSGKESRKGCTSLFLMQQSFGG